MKSTALGKSRRLRSGGPGVSLFPFLAVLICTMGALVPLLSTVTRQARQQALRAAAAKQSAQLEDLKAGREMAQWRITQLQKSRQETESQLGEARLYLGHIEDHARRLRGKLEELHSSGKNLDQAGGEVLRRREALAGELKQGQGQIAAARQRLTDATQAADKRPRSYAVIPYRGPNETHRRPIYVECRVDAVVLQPEGIVFTEKDFEGPLGPGNPLATALRANREYLLRQGGFDPGRDGDPYPLLLVRPDGIVAYYAARKGMESYGSEFGYELIGDDWRLEYQPADPQLAQLLSQTVASARQQQQQLIAAAPRSYGGSHLRGARYRVGPSGGLMREDGSADEEGDNGSGSGYRSGRTAGPYGSNHGSAGDADSGSGGPPSAGTAGTASAPAGPVHPMLPYGQPGPPVGQPGGVGPGTVAMAGDEPASGWHVGTPGTGGASGTLAGTGGAGGTPAGPVLGEPGGSGIGVGPGGSTGLYGSPASTGGASGTPAGTGGASGTLGSGGTLAGNSGPGGTPGPKITRPEDYVMGRPPVEQPPPRGEPPPDAQPGTPLRPGEWHPRPEAPPPKPDDETDKMGRHKKVHSMAEDRGEDWGLRKRSHGIAISRPLRVECYADRLLLVTEPGVAPAKVEPLGPNTEAAIDRFIADVWEHMDAWGMAGKGMYWKPILNVQVAPGGEQRFAEICTLLEGSGLSVVRR
ncbi:MAG: hypothetical protein ABSG68_10465 [Thermoguttaceae bacterium]